jgi:multiple sugar transport system permease protein
VRLSPTRRAMLTLANVGVIAFLLLPLLPVVIGALQSERALQSDLRSLLPRQLTLANFELILSGGAHRGPIFEQVTYLPKSVERFPAAFMNSIAVATSVSLLTLVFASYVLFRRYGLLNSLSGVVIAEIGFLLPYAVLILVPYFAALPGELEDAARIDGCTRFGAFVRIVLPLAAPGLAACATIMFILSWHELLIPLIVVSRPEVMTVPVVLAGLVSDYFVFFTLMMAICLLGLLPTLLLVLLLQKYVVRGLVAGALKG